MSQDASYLNSVTIVDEKVRGINTRNLNVQQQVKRSKVQALCPKKAVPVLRCARTEYVMIFTQN